MDVAKLTKERRQKLGRMEALLLSAEASDRELSETERREYDTLERDVVELGRQIRAGFDPRRQTGLFDRPQNQAGQPDILGPDQRMVDWVAERRHEDLGAYGDHETFSFGRILTALVRRDRSHLTEFEKRALVEGVDASGGYLTPEVLGAEVIDRLRNVGRTFEAGVRVVPMTSDQLMFARLTAGVTPDWKSEGNAITDKSMTFDRVTLKVKTLPLLVKISQELFDDLSPQAASVIEDEMTKALALELDRVILRGSGVDPEPLGILNQTGVTQQLLATNGATPTGYKDIATAISTIRQNNLEPTAVILNAKTAGYYDGLTDSTGQPLQKPPSVDQLKFLVSNQVPSNTTAGSSGAVCSEAYVAQWDQTLVGMRTDIRVGIRALTQRFADNLQVGLLCYLRADVAMRHGESAVVLTGIKTA